jgi:hypothetical protein
MQITILHDHAVTVDVVNAFGVRVVSYACVEDLGAADGDIVTAGRDFDGIAAG